MADDDSRRAERPAPTPDCGSAFRCDVELAYGQRLDRETSVRDNILGTEIYGRRGSMARPGVKLTDCPDQATFQVIVDGTAHSRSTGYNRQAIIYSHSVTSFTATKQVIFEPGRGFYALPPQVRPVRKRSSTASGSSRGGIVGRIVRRRAARGRSPASRRGGRDRTAEGGAADRRRLRPHVEQRLARSTARRNSARWSCRYCALGERRNPNMPAARRRTPADRGEFRRRRPGDRVARQGPGQPGRGSDRSLGSPLTVGERLAAALQLLNDRRECQRLAARRCRRRHGSSSGRAAIAVVPIWRPSSGRSSLSRLGTGP